MGTLNKGKGETENLQLKSVSFTNADTGPKTVWNPPGSGKVRPHNIVICVQNKSGNSNIACTIEGRRKGTWYDLIKVGVRSQGFETKTLNYFGLIRFQNIRVKSAGNSSSWDCDISIAGRERE